MFRATFFVACLATGVAAAADGDAPLHDPMRPYAAVASGTPAAGPSGPRFTLTAVVISDTRQIAVVNGKPYLLGESVDGAEIVRIESQSVRLRDGGRDLVIPLGRSGVSARSASQGETAQ